MASANILKMAGQNTTYLQKAKKLPYHKEALYNMVYSLFFPPCQIKDIAPHDRENK